MTQLISCGAYVPRLRLERATVAAAMSWLKTPGNRDPAGARSICNWDEDSLTMGVEAARRCLTFAGDIAGGPPPPIERVVFASTTLPFADRSNSGLLAAALALDGDIQTADVTGSLRCGTSALIQALQSNAATLVVAADKRQAKPGSPQELELGHGAAAVLVGPDSADSARGIGERGDASHGGDASRSAGIEYLGSASLARDFVDHHRSQDADFDYVLEERWARDEAYLKLIPRTITRALEAAKIAPAEVKCFICPSPAAVTKKIAQASGIAADSIASTAASRVGHLGSAESLLSLALALDTVAAGDVIVLIGFGQGVDAIVLRATAPATRTPAAAALAGGVPEKNYVRYLSHNGLADVDFGMRAERDHRSAQTVAYRKRDAVTAFVGGKCSACGTVQFPRSRICVNPPCRQTDTQQPYRLADSAGRVKTFTEDWQAYSPRPPYIYGNVGFEEGGNLFMEFTDLEPGELEMNTAVRFAFRVKDIDRTRQFRRYFWKAIPSE